MINRCVFDIYEGLTILWLRQSKLRACVRVCVWHDVIWYDYDLCVSGQLYPPSDGESENKNEQNLSSNKSQLHTLHKSPVVQLYLWLQPPRSCWWENCRTTISVISHTLWRIHKCRQHRLTCGHAKHDTHAHFPCMHKRKQKKHIAEITSLEVGENIS